MGKSPSEEYAMLESQYETQQSPLRLNDILFILFRHKWKILLLTLAGLLAAAAVYLLSQTYESQAKLLVRYVAERTTLDKLDTPIETPNSQITESFNILNSEVEILTSWDLATQVAQEIGVERLLPDSRVKPTITAAARKIANGLKVTPLKGSNILSVSYQNNDPTLVVPVLQKLVTKYFDKHLEVHRSIGAFDFVKRETDRVHAQLDQTEQQLNQLKARVGITSLAEGTATINAELKTGQDELAAAEAQLAAQRARVKSLERWVSAADGDGAQRQPSGKVVHEYQDLFNRAEYLRKMETELLSRYTPENPLVKTKQAQIDDLEKQQRDLEQRFPSIVATISMTGASQNSRPDLMAERSQLAEMEAKTQALGSQLSSVQERAKLLTELGPQMADLERERELEATNYKYFEASLERAHVDETLDPSRMPNISVVQKPSPAVRTIGDVKKIVLALAGGGLALGIGLALLIELVLDRTIKRPLELEDQLSIPLLLSVPRFGHNGDLRLRADNTDGDPMKGLPEHTDGSIAPWESEHCIRPFCDALRDRLIFYFQLNRMTHKPKLVAVTGLSKGAGASTLAAGLAASLSEEGRGKVILVDEQPDLKRFYRLVSEFKRSEYDYVIFDLPSLSNTSPTLAMAGFLDKVLLVVEAEKSSRDAVKRAYEKLAAGHARVSVVFNKSRPTGVKWLECEV
jgi:polysaccharide biosynthesis transport protein